MSPVQHLCTAEQFRNAPGNEHSELIRGEVVDVAPSGFEHGSISNNLGRLLGNFVVENRLGVVTGSEAGYLIGRDPDTVRAPDIGFVRQERLGEAPIPGFFPGPPDLAVEVLSPNDLASELLAKVHDWLDSGCRAVWVVDPRAKTVTIYEPGRPVWALGKAGRIESPDLLPGFSLSVADIFTP